MADAVDDGGREVLWCFLRQVVADATREIPMLVLAGELRGVRRRSRMRRAVGVAFERDRGHRHHWPCGEPALECIERRLAGSQAQPPAVVVDHDAHVIWVVERGGAAIETWHHRTPISAMRFARLARANSRRCVSYPTRPRSVAK